MSCYCEIGHGESPSFFTSTERKARKPHKCVECVSVISPGERYIEERGCWDGRINVHHTCMSCKEIRDMWEAEPSFEGFTFGSVGCWYSGYLESVMQAAEDGRLGPAKPRHLRSWNDPAWSL